MSHLQHRSLKYEYELYVEREIEDYKDSIPRSAISASAMKPLPGFARRNRWRSTSWSLGEVDRIITSRLRIPSYAGWKRRRLKLSRVPPAGTWGCALTPVGPRDLRRARKPTCCHGPAVSESTLYLAANGCTVTAVGDAP
jgi:hypothetical protein